MRDAPGRRLPRPLHPGAWWLWAARDWPPPPAAPPTRSCCCWSWPWSPGGGCPAHRRPLGARLQDVRDTSGSLVIVDPRRASASCSTASTASTCCSRCPSSRCPRPPRGSASADRCRSRAIAAAFYDGLRLATLLLCVGAANVLANPKRLLKAVPAALHEVGVAVTVALTVAPQLIESGQRVPGRPSAPRRGRPAPAPAPRDRHPRDDRRPRPIAAPRRGHGLARLRARGRRPRRGADRHRRAAARGAGGDLRSAPTACSTAPHPDGSASRCSWAARRWGWLGMRLAVGGCSAAATGPTRGAAPSGRWSPLGSSWPRWWSRRQRGRPDDLYPSLQPLRWPSLPVPPRRCQCCLVPLPPGSPRPSTGPLRRAARRPMLAVERAA